MSDYVNPYDSWVPEEHDSEVMELLRKTSAVESLAVKYSMHWDAVELSDGLLLRSEKLARAQELSLEDIDDPGSSTLENSRLDWVRDAGIFLDSMCLGTVNPSRGTDMYRLHKPVHLVSPKKTQSLYARDDVNRFYASSEEPGDLVGLLNGLAGYVQQAPAYLKNPGLHNMDARPGIIAHPKFRKFIDPKKTGVVSGLKVKWSMGCAATEEPSHLPEGNPLLFIGNMSALNLGVRSGPESQLVRFDHEWADEQRRSKGLAFPYMDDEGNLSPENEEKLEQNIQERLGKAWLKMRMRRAFTVNPLYPFHCVELVNQ